MASNRVNRWRSTLGLLAVFTLLAALLPIGAALAAPGIVINEIHADPASGPAGDANGDGIRDFSDDEFVELVNDGPADVDISGWTLSDSVGVRHIFPAGSVVSANCSVVVFGGPSPTGSFGNGVVQTASTGALGLNNSGDTVTINDGTSDVDTYTYGSEGGDNQSLTRDPDTTSPFVKHSLATGSGGSLWSPGTQIDGTGYAGCPAPPLGVTGAATPAILAAGEATLFTATVTPGSDPTSTAIAVEGDLTAIGGSANQPFFDDGTNGDDVAGDNVFSFLTAVDGATPPGDVSLPVTATDEQGRTGTTPINLTVAHVLTIMQIQGDDQYSPFQDDYATTSGVVTAISDNGEDGWIQDPTGDGNPATSDGIFIDDFDSLSPQPTIGDLVEIIGQVEEQQFGTALPLTRIDDTRLISIVSSGNALPAPSQLTDQPNESVPAAIELLEAVEGMRVAVSNGFVVSPTSRFGEFALLTNKDAKKGSGYEPSIKQILVRALSQDPNVVDYNPERILVDDATLVEPLQVQPGDKVKSIVGVMDYTFSNYKIQPTDYDIVAKPLPNAPASKRNGPTGDTTITTYNVENLFDLELNIPEVVDSIGRIGEDPGDGWTGGGISTKDQTLRRKADVCSGDANATDPFDPSIEWDGLAKDTFDGLGTHTVTCGPTDGLIISEYVEGRSFNKALEIFNGTGDTVNLNDVRVQIFFNGSTNAGQTISLSGTLSDGDVYVLANPEADPAILDVTDQTSNGVLFNGDDAVTLNVGGKDDFDSTPASPEELDVQLTKLALAIEDELRLPEIVVLQEVENTAIAQELGDRVNASAGTGYVAVSEETSDGRGIEVAFLFDDDRVDLLEAFQLNGPAIQDAFGPESPSPGRQPLYGRFAVGDEEIHIVGNHFKSKGGDDPIFGVNQPFNRPTEVQRKAQARAVRSFVNDLLAADPNALVMVTGDLNDFAFGEPNEGNDDPVAILEGVDGGAPFTNLVNMEKEKERWTFIFDGNSQVLDHMLINDAMLAELAGTDILHFNAAIPSVVGADPTTSLRASDHEALEGRFWFEK